MLDGSGSCQWTRALLILMAVVLMASLKSFSSNVVLIFGDERLPQSPALTEKGGENVLLFLAWVKGSPDYTQMDSIRMNCTITKKYTLFARQSHNWPFVTAKYNFQTEFC